MPAPPRNSRSAGPKRNRSIASSSRPVPATTPYLRPCGRCLAKTSKMALRSAAPLRSDACSMVSSYWSVSSAVPCWAVPSWAVPEGSEPSGGWWFTGFVTGGRLRSGRWVVVSTAPAEVDLPRSADSPSSDRPWVTIVWNDPVNLMSYVTYVFQRVFGYAKPKAEKLMLDVHHKGKAVVSSGTREAMERNAETLHGYGLWATVSHDS